jgi:hypothetical protein
MRAASWIVLSLLALGAAACGGGSRNDAGVVIQTFNVDNTGSQLCPGLLFRAASEGVAICNTAPQRCISNAADAGSSQIVCDCRGDGDGGSGAMGTWVCTEARP